MTGQLIIAVSLLVAALCMNYEKDTAAVVAILVSIGTFHLSLGPLSWIILFEVLNDSQFAFCTSIYFAFAVVNYAFTDFMLRYHYSVILLVTFCCVNIIGFVFTFKIVEETQHLSYK